MYLTRIQAIFNTYKPLVVLLLLILWNLHKYSLFCNIEYACQNGYSSLVICEKSTCKIMYICPLKAGIKIGFYVVLNKCTDVTSCTCYLQKLPLPTTLCVGMSWQRCEVDVQLKLVFLCLASK